MSSLIIVFCLAVIGAVTAIAAYVGYVIASPFVLDKYKKIMEDALFVFVCVCIAACLFFNLVSSHISEGSVNKPQTVSSQ